MYEFVKEMFFNEKAQGKKFTRDTYLIRLLKSPGKTLSASGVSSSHEKESLSKTMFCSSDPNELCNRLKLLLQEKQAGKNLI